jgi:hypothetical protein
MNLPQKLAHTMLAVTLTALFCSSADAAQVHKTNPTKPAKSNASEEVTYWLKNQKSTSPETDVTVFKPKGTDRTCVLTRDYTYSSSLNISTAMQCWQTPNQK